MANHRVMLCSNFTGPERLGTRGGDLNAGAVDYPSVWVVGHILRLSTCPPVAAGRLRPRHQSAGSLAAKLLLQPAGWGGRVARTLFQSVTTPDRAVSSSCTSATFWLARCLVILAPLCAPYPTLQAHMPPAPPPAPPLNLLHLFLAAQVDGRPAGQQARRWLVSSWAKEGRPPRHNQRSKGPCAGSSNPTTHALSQPLLLACHGWRRAASPGCGRCPSSPCRPPATQGMQEYRRFGKGQLGPSHMVHGRGPFRTCRSHTASTDTAPGRQAHQASMRTTSHTPVHGGQHSSTPPAPPGRPWGSTRTAHAACPAGGKGGGNRSKHAGLAGKQGVTKLSPCTQAGELCSPRAAPGEVVAGAVAAQRPFQPFQPKAPAHVGALLVGGVHKDASVQQGAVHVGHHGAHIPAWGGEEMSGVRGKEELAHGRPWSKGLERGTTQLKGRQVAGVVLRQNGGAGGSHRQAHCTSEVGLCSRRTHRRL